MFFNQVLLWSSLGLWAGSSFWISRIQIFHLDYQHSFKTKCTEWSCFYRVQHVMWSPLGLWSVIIHRCLMKVMFSLTMWVKVTMLYPSLCRNHVDHHREPMIKKRSSRLAIDYILEYDELFARNIFWLRSRWNYTVKRDLGNMLLWGSLKTQEWGMTLFSHAQRWTEKLWREKSLYLSSLNSKFYKIVFYSRLVARCSLALAGTVVVLIRCRRLGEDSSKKSVWNWRK